MPGARQVILTPSVPRLVRAGTIWILPWDVKGSAHLVSRLISAAGRQCMLEGDSKEYIQVIDGRFEERL